MVDATRRLGASRIQGEYIPTSKNGMVSDLYQRLGFTIEDTTEAGATIWTLDLAAYQKKPVIMDVLESVNA
jgi:predicted enzyme involved in methoxymalonyl-ACP biosynthesis